MTTLSPTLNKEQVDIFNKEVNPLVIRANELVVTNMEENTQAQEALKQIKTKYKEIYAKFHPTTEATHKAWKAAKEIENFFCDPFKKAEKIIKEKCVSFQVEEQRKQEEAARKARAEAEEKERKQREKLEAKAKKKKKKKATLRRPRLSGITLRIFSQHLALNPHKNLW